MKDVKDNRYAYALEQADRFMDMDIKDPQKAHMTLTQMFIGAMTWEKQFNDTNKKRNAR